MNKEEMETALFEISVLAEQAKELMGVAQETYQDEKDKGIRAVLFTATDYFYRIEQMSNIE